MTTAIWQTTYMRWSTTRRQSDEPEAEDQAMNGRPSRTRLLSTLGAGASFTMAVLATSKVSLGMALFSFGIFTLLAIFGGEKEN